MYYTVYKITNEVNNKIYIGCHKTEDLDDDYMGSGKVLKKSIKKYGIGNFTKEYLHIFDNPDDMFDMETQLVNEDFIKDESNYNLTLGGKGGFDGLDQIQGQKRLKNLWFDDEHSDWRKNTSEQISRGLNSYYQNGGKNGFKGKTHSDSMKQNISKLQKEIDRCGDKNPKSVSVIDGDGNIFNTLKECAEYHNVHVNTIGNWIKKGKITKG